MSFNFDIDEADVAVLTQNLTKSKELFNSISKSLNKISTKADTASRKIKPVLRQVNKLNDSKSEIENGLELVAEVQQYASKAATNEQILNGTIDNVGIKKYLTVLIQSKLLLKEMKSKVGQFKGILINFQNSIEKSEFGLTTYFQKLIKRESTPLDLRKYNFEESGGLPQISQSKIKDYSAILDYFHGVNSEDRSLDRMYMMERSRYLFDTIASLDSITAPKLKTNNKIPYERGTNGIGEYSKTLMDLCVIEAQQVEEINRRLVGPKLDINEYLFSILANTINDKYGGDQLMRIVKHVENNTTTDGLLALETIINVKQVEKCLYKLIASTGIHSNFKKFLDNFMVLKKLCQSIFKELLRFIEQKIVALDKLPNDNGVSEVTVELMSRIRKISDFRESCLEVIEGMKIGSWMMQTPKPRSISVFSSVLPANEMQNEHDSKYLLSSYFSDCIDSIMINLEIISKQGDLKLQKKSIQGYFLITNLTLIEQIINRSSELFKSLGSTGMERLNKLKKRFLVLFLDDWNYASYIIIRDMTSITATAAIAHNSNSNNTNSHGNAPPSGKEKEQIKELFKTFNESFEDAINNYKNFNITDQNLRAYLANEIKKLIMNTYFKLYDKYGTSDFTKNKSKYVKYDKKSFEDLLNSTL
ncbi:exocyst complex component Exo70p [[Candida] anglica]|uniref:Exocyst complex protein EXO70 n=1 Tax=[Candida] anglica TaxID=148631 RepID=A0ABP0EET6_9ASCO